MTKNRLFASAILGFIAGSIVLSPVLAAGSRGVPVSAAAQAQIESVVHSAPNANADNGRPTPPSTTPAPKTSNKQENNSTSSTLQSAAPAGVKTEGTSTTNTSAPATREEPSSISPASHRAAIQSMILDLEQEVQLLLAELSITTNNAGSGHVHQFRPRLDPKGNVLHGVRNEVESSNWSGYVVTKYATSQKYTAASGTWVVPAVNTVSAGYSSSWVGIGGFCINAACTQVDHTLIQLGTEQEADGFGNTNYYAWYEMLPNPEIKIKNFPINPGDVITASLEEINGHGRHGTWTLSLEDKTTGSAWSRSFVYDSSMASAEWIEEAPYSGVILPLADYGTANFDSGTVNNGEDPALDGQEGVVMYNPNGQTSNPSAPDSDTNGFNSCWGDYSALTACSPSNS